MSDVGGCRPLEVLSELEVLCTWDNDLSVPWAAKEWMLSLQCIMRILGVQATGFVKVSVAWCRTDLNWAYSPRRSRSASHPNPVAPWIASEKKIVELPL